MILILTLLQHNSPELYLNVLMENIILLFINYVSISNICTPSMNMIIVLYNNTPISTQYAKCNDITYTIYDY